MMFEIIRKLILLGLKIKGWKYDTLPNLQSGIYILPTHTHAYDGMHAFIASYVYRLKPITFLIENFYDKAPKLFSKLGFIRVPDMDNRSSTSFVPLFREIRKKIKATEGTWAIGICPEGNREYVDHWKSSFMYLAKTLKAPIYTIRLDYRQKFCSLAEPIYLSEMTEDEAMEKIRASFDPSWAYYPEKVGNPVILKD